MKRAWSEESHVFGNAAPKARNMRARGKREARRPWYTNQSTPALKGRNMLEIFRPFMPDHTALRKPEPTRFALAPGSHICAPLALHPDF